MAIENFNEDVEVIQKLDTLPNQEGGLSAEELKAKFDQAAMAIKNFINNSLLPVVRELEDAKDPSVIYGLDQTLSELGRAADAKAVGEALAGKVGTKDIIDITHGGTGADNAEAARRNLDAAKTAHTHSVSDMNTGLLPLERGGTGAGTAAQAMENLGITAALAGKAPVALGAPHNYLDNSDFRNPVNQRGQTTYNSGGYCIDRWYASAWNGDLAVTVENGGLRLSGGTAGTANACYIEQRLDATKLRGKTFTFVIKNIEFIAQFDDKINVFCDGNRIKKGTIVSGGIDLVVFTVPENAEQIAISVGGLSSYGGNGIINALLEWAALYEGEYTAETLPDYKPKGYGAELAECQLYYRHFNRDAIGTGYTSSGGGAAVMYFPHTMRIPNPTAVWANVFCRVNGNDYPANNVYPESTDGVTRFIVQAPNVPGKHATAFYSTSQFAVSAEL